MRYDVVVVGAGAAGLLAAAASARRGKRTLLLEKNKKLGVKILMSGGTRCNITHATDSRGIAAAFGKNGRFLHSALAAFSPDDVVDLLANLGVPSHVESTGKIFPDSNRAIDVRDALVRYARESGAEIVAGCGLQQLDRENSNGFLLALESKTLAATSVIVTTGGQSFPGCGTTGDGYSWAKQFGHTIIPTRPALVPIICSDPWLNELSGITVDDVQLSLAESGTTKVVDQRRGSFLFTHFGVSGPVPMNISGTLTRYDDPGQLQMFAHFLPNENTDSIREQILGWGRSAGGRRAHSLFQDQLPNRLLTRLLELTQIDAVLPIGELSKQKISTLAHWLTRCPLHATGTKGFAKAEVTAGGVALDGVDSRTMQSKLVPGLFFAGEILDLDGPIGGFNFQSAFSTGWLAGNSV